MNNSVFTACFMTEILTYLRQSGEVMYIYSSTEIYFYATFHEYFYLMLHYIFVCMYVYIYYISEENTVLIYYILCHLTAVVSNDWLIFNFIYVTFDASLWLSWRCFTTFTETCSNRLYLPLSGSRRGLWTQRKHIMIFYVLIANI